MSEEPPNLRSSLQMVRRHKILVGVIMLLGLIAGGGYSVEKPPIMTSSALVLLPTSIKNVATQVVIAESDPVLAGAAHNLDPPQSLQALQGRVQANSVTSNMLSITAEGKTAALAEQTANAVAGSYIAYVGSANAPGGEMSASVLERAAGATGTTLAKQVAITALIGAFAGALLGAIIAMAISRGDRRLRDRDDIADAVGVPVLASMRVSRPSDARGWTRLLEDYRPTAVEALRLRSTLDQLGIARAADATGRSIAVLSLEPDRGALAVAPQLAAFAAGLGIPTVLVFGPQQNPEAAATLRVACADLEKQPKPVKNLWVGVSGGIAGAGLADAGLNIVVSVVDSRSPDAAVTMRTADTLLAVSSGAATAEQLARVAASALADGRYIAGILVADPDPADRTTGRRSHGKPPEQRRMPTRITRRSVETRS